MPCDTTDVRQGCQALTGDLFMIGTTKSYGNGVPQDYHNSFIAHASISQVATKALVVQVGARRRKQHNKRNGTCRYSSSRGTPSQSDYRGTKSLVIYPVIEHMRSMAPDGSVAEQP